MKNRILLFLLLFILLFTNNSNAQQWIKYFGGNLEDKAYAITIDNSGYVIAAGYSNVQGHGADFCTVKINPQTGSTLWTRYYNGPASQDDKAYVITVDGQNNIYVAGFSTGLGTGTDMAAVKYSSSGTQLAVYTYNSTTNGDDEALAVAVDDSLNVYLAGFVTLAGYDMYIVRFSSGGIYQWGQPFGGNANQDDKAYAINIDDQDNVFISGYTVNNTTNADFTLIKYNRHTGSRFWYKKYDGPAHLDDIPSCMVLSEQNHLYLSGSSELNSSFNSEDFMTIRVNPSTGDPVWTRRYNGSAESSDKVYAITVDKLDNIYLTGSTTVLTDNTFNTDFMTIKYSPLGDSLWSVSFDTNLTNCIGKALCLSHSDEFLYVTGSTTKGDNLDSQNIATVKYDALTGEKLQASVINGAGNGEDDVAGVVLDSTDNVFLGGYMTNASHSIDMFVSKYYHGDLIEVKNISTGVPKDFLLYQNYPNPFNPSTTIKFDVKQSGTVKLVIYDVLGRFADVVVNENLRPGMYEVTYSPAGLSSGVYFYEMTSGDYKEIKKMIFVK